MWHSIKIDIWWPLVTSMLTWAKKWPKYFRLYLFRAIERFFPCLSIPLSFWVRRGGHFDPPTTMAKVVETATLARINPRPAWGGGQIFPHPAGFSRKLKNAGRYRRETFSAFLSINLTSATRISEKKPSKRFWENGVLVTSCSNILGKKAANFEGC